MIRKNKESKRTLSTFKKFSELDKSTKVSDGDGDMVEHPFGDDDIPMNPNLPNSNGRMPKTMNTNDLMPIGQSITNDAEEEKEEEVTNENVEFYGKVAKLPKGVKASKGFNFLENVKVSKSSIWYILVEKQDNQLQMVKYNHKKGVDLTKFVNELKTFYKSSISGDDRYIKLIENIQVDGNDKYSWIKNIPPIEINKKKMITKITEDLIKLLSR